MSFHILPSVESAVNVRVLLLCRKQCIESEKLFDFLKDLVEEAASTGSKKDGRAMSVWPLYRYTLAEQMPTLKHSNRWKNDDL